MENENPEKVLDTSYLRDKNLSLNLLHKENFSKNSGGADKADREKSVLDSNTREAFPTPVVPESIVRIKPTRQRLLKGKLISKKKKLTEESQNQHGHPLDSLISAVPMLLILKHDHESDMTDQIIGTEIATNAVTAGINITQQRLTLSHAKAKSDFSVDDVEKPRITQVVVLSAEAERQPVPVPVEASEHEGFSEFPFVLWGFELPLIFI